MSGVYGLAQWPERSGLPLDSCGAGPAGAAAQAASAMSCAAAATTTVIAFAMEPPRPTSLLWYLTSVPYGGKSLQRRNWLGPSPEGCALGHELWPYLAGESRICATRKAGTQSHDRMEMIDAYRL